MLGSTCTANYCENHLHPVLQRLEYLSYPGVWWELFVSAVTVELGSSKSWSTGRNCVPFFLFITPHSQTAGHNLNTS